MNDLISERHTSSCEIRGMPPSCSSVYYLSELRNPVYFTGSTPSVQTGYLIILHGYTIPKCIRSFNDFIIRDDADARSVQKTPAGVLTVRRGLFFVKRQRRCTVYFKRTRGCIFHDTPAHIKTVYLLQKDFQTQNREQHSCFWG